MNACSVRRFSATKAPTALILALGLAACMPAAPVERVDVWTTVPMVDVPTSLVDVRLTAPEPTEYSFFGHSVAIDGGSAVVGAWGVAANTGGAYVFAQEYGTWELQQVLRAPAGLPKDRFGHAVAVHGDTVVVGAVHESTRGFRAGAAHVFEGSGGSWAHVQTLSSPEPVAYQQFGSAVGVAVDTIVVGASGFSRPAAYVYREAAGTWEAQQVLEPEDTGQRTRFGRALALHDQTLVIAAAGSTHVFEFEDSEWRATDVLRGSSDIGSVATDSESIVIGEPNRGAFVYTRDADGWEADVALEAGDVAHFGTSVAVYADRILVGASGQAGAVFEYRKVDDIWVLQRQFTAAEPTENLHFGLAAAITGQHVIIGATGARDGGIASGAAYLFP